MFANFFLINSNPRLHSPEGGTANETDKFVTGDAHIQDIALLWGEIVYCSI